MCVSITNSVGVYTITSDVHFDQMPIQLNKKKAIRRYKRAQNKPTV